jgi:hypothetical protein
MVTPGRKRIEGAVDRVDGDGAPGPACARLRVRNVRPMRLGHTSLSRIHAQLSLIHNDHSSLSRIHGQLSLIQYTLISLSHTHAHLSLIHDAHESISRIYAHPSLIHNTMIPTRLSHAYTLISARAAARPLRHPSESLLFSAPSAAVSSSRRCKSTPPDGGNYVHLCTLLVRCKLGSPR